MAQQAYNFTDRVRQVLEGSGAQLIQPVSP